MCNYSNSKCIGSKFQINLFQMQDYSKLNMKQEQMANRQRYFLEETSPRVNSNDYSKPVITFQDQSSANESSYPAFMLGLQPVKQHVKSDASERIDQFAKYLPDDATSPTSQTQQKPSHHTTNLNSWRELSARRQILSQADENFRNAVQVQESINLMNQRTEGFKNLNGMQPEMKETHGLKTVHEVPNSMAEETFKTKNSALYGEMSSFDQRCTQTKALVASLAQKLNDVKRDTSWELSQLQKSKSTSPLRNASDTGKYVSSTGKGSGINTHSNSRSPNNTVHNNIRGQLSMATRIPKATVSIQRVSSSANAAPILTENVSPKNNDVSMVSTASGLNFKQLKPEFSPQHDINHRLTGSNHFDQSPPLNSMYIKGQNDLVQYQQKQQTVSQHNQLYSHVTGFEQNSNQQQNFGNSIRTFANSKEDPKSTSGNLIDKMQREENEGVMSDIKSNDSIDDMLNNRQIDLQQALASSELQRQLKAIAQTLGQQSLEETKTQLSINGANLNSILQEIRDNGSQALSPIQANNLAAACAIASQLENSGTVQMKTVTHPIGTPAATPHQTNKSLAPLLQDCGRVMNMPLVTQSTPTNIPSRNIHNVGIQESQGTTFQNQALRKSPLFSEETGIMLNSKSQIQLSAQQSDFGQQLTQNNTMNNLHSQLNDGIDNTPEKAQHFQQMHFDIMKLHEKIRNLEGQIGTETIPKTESYPGTHQDDASSIPYHQDAKHMKLSSLSKSQQNWNAAQQYQQSTASMVINTHSSPKPMDDQSQLRDENIEHPSNRRMQSHPQMLVLQLANNQIEKLNNPGNVGQSQSINIQNPVLQNQINNLLRENPNLQLISTANFQEQAQEHVHPKSQRTEVQSLAQQIQDSHRSRGEHEVLVTNDHLLSFQRQQDGMMSQPNSYTNTETDGNAEQEEVTVEDDKTNGYLVTGSSACGSPVQEQQVANETQREHQTTENMLSNVNANVVGETSRSRSRSQNGTKKQTFPLRVRKQVFVKESVGTTTLHTNVHDKSCSVQQFEQQIRSDADQSNGSAMRQKRKSREESQQYIFTPPETQETQYSNPIVPYYETQLNSKQQQHPGEGTWSNQTSRFQNENSVNDSKQLQSFREETPYIPNDYTMQTQQTQQHQNVVHRLLIEDQSPIQVDYTHGRMQSNLPSHHKKSQDHGSSVLSEESCTILEQRPFSPQSQQNITVSTRNDTNYQKPLKNNLNKDLPLQTTHASVLSDTADNGNKVRQLMQRNNHLELELKRSQQRLGQKDSLTLKYKDLKLDYKQLCQSFERSEEIRREQKELISDQKKQMKGYKTKLKKQEQRVQEMMHEIQTVKGQNGLQFSMMSGKAMIQQDLDNPATCYTGRSNRSLSHRSHNSRTSSASCKTTTPRSQLSKNSRTASRDKLPRAQSGSKTIAKNPLPPRYFHSQHQETGGHQSNSTLYLNSQLVMPSNDYNESKKLFQSTSNLRNTSSMTRNQAHGQQDALRRSRSKKKIMATGYSVIDMSMGSNHVKNGSKSKKKDKKKKHKNRHKSKQSGQSQSSIKSARKHKKSSKKGKDGMELSHHNSGVEKNTVPHTTKNRKLSVGNPAMGNSANMSGKVQIFNIQTSLNQTKNPNYQPMSFVISDKKSKHRRIRAANDSMNRSMSGANRRMNMSNTSDTEKIVNGKAVPKERTTDSGVRKLAKNNVFY